MNMKEFIEVAKNSGFDYTIIAKKIVYIHSKIAVNGNRTIARFKKDDVMPTIFTGPNLAFKDKIIYGCYTDDSIFDKEVFAKKINEIYLDEKKLMKEIRRKKIEEL